MNESAKRWALGVGSTLVSAVAFGCAFPPTAWWPLAWVALAPFFVALRGASPRRALLLGWLWSIGVAWVTGDWLPPTVSEYFGQTRAVGLLFFVGITSTMGAPYYMAFAVAYRPLARHFGLASPLLIAAAWTAAELVRGRLLNGTLLYFGSTPWATAGYSQVGVDELVQIASVAGVYGISFAIAACNTGLVESLVSPSRARLRVAALTSACVPLAIIAGFGVWTLASAPAVDAPPTNGGTKIAIVQGNLSSDSRWRAEFYGRNLRKYRDLTGAALEDFDPDVVFWPEAAMTFFLEKEPAYLRFLGRMLSARSGGAELVAGSVRETATEEASTYSNSVYRIEPDGAVRGRYDKQFLVPFTETFPFRSVELLRRNFGSAREFTPGTDAAPLETRAGKAGILICNEAMLPHVAAQRVRDGAEYLVNPSNDSWSSDEKFSEQQFDIVALRAVELRRTLVRSSTSGPSAIVDPWGRVLARTDLLSEGAIGGKVEARSDSTLYARWGDWFGVVCALASGFALASSMRHSPGRR